MTAQTLTQLRQLKLGTMADALQIQSEQVNTYEGMPFTERLSLLLSQETTARKNSKHTRLVRQAKFKLKANIQGVDYQHPRNIKREQIAQLASCGWIHQKQNLLITGPCASGKTYLACALGHNAFIHEHSVRYYRLSRLFLELTQAKADGSYRKHLKALAKVQVLTLDDWGLEAMEAAQRNDLMEIMDDRHGDTSTVVLSQLPTSQWYNCIGDNTLADAILDRLMHNAHRLELKGESMRKIKGKVDPS